MQSDHFNSFINSITSLTSEQRGILNNSLLSSEVLYRDSVETANSDSVCSESYSKKQPAEPDLETSIMSRFESIQNVPNAKVTVLIVGVFEMADSASVARLAR